MVPAFLLPFNQPEAMQWEMKILKASSSLMSESHAILIICRSDQMNPKAEVLEAAAVKVRSSERAERRLIKLRVSEAAAPDVL